MYVDVKMEKQTILFTAGLLLAFGIIAYFVVAQSGKMMIDVYTGEKNSIPFDSNCVADFIMGTGNNTIIHTLHFVTNSSKESDVLSKINRAMKYHLNTQTYRGYLNQTKATYINMSDVYCGGDKITNKFNIDLNLK